VHNNNNNKKKKTKIFVRKQQEEQNGILNSNLKTKYIQKVQLEFFNILTQQNKMK